MDGRRIRPLFLPPHPRRNRYIPSSRQTNSRGHLVSQAKSNRPVEFVFLSALKQTLQGC
nr:MAG TPA: hypothetical protein [Caudoviricetes sp.]